MGAAMIHIFLFHSFLCSTGGLCMQLPISEEEGKWDVRCGMKTVGNTLPN